MNPRPSISSVAPNSVSQIPGRRPVETRPEGGGGLSRGMARLLGVVFGGALAFHAAAVLPAAPIYEAVASFPIPAASPLGDLVAGTDGNFYGTTSNGGTGGFGTVFKVSPTGVVTSLVEFTGNGPANKGACPTAGLVSAIDGNFYGTTAKGGAADLGTIFKMTPAGSLTTLVEFTGNGAFNKGALPYSGLVQAASGTFFGTTSHGGAKDFGTMFSMTAGGTLTTLVEFTGNAGSYKGAYPYASVIQAADGRLFGTTARGGVKGNGTAFRWTSPGVFETIVEFTDNGAISKGASPYAALIQGTDGMIYGTTSKGGVKDLGTIFRMTTGGALTTMVEFADSAATTKGAYPEAPLVFGADGSLYGTTATGGASGNGTLFNLTTAGAFSTLLEFTGNSGANRGTFPQAGLTKASDGTLFGATGFGGTSAYGTLFKITPVGTLTTLVSPTYSVATRPGIYPQAGLVAGSDGNFYGTTLGGGLRGVGAIYRLRLRALAAPQTASSVESQLARLNAVVSPGVLDATVSFDYGKTSNYGSATSGQTISRGLTQVPVWAALDGLLPNTTYHFRVVVTDSSGTLIGADQTFTTEPLASDPLATGDTIGAETVAALGVPSIDDSGAVVVLATLAAGTVKSTAILGGSPPAVVARIGQEAPLPDGSTASTRVFTKFSDPACDKLGNVAFAASIRDGTVARTGLWSESAGGLKEVALIGGAAGDVPNAHFTAVKSFAISGTGEVYFLATIAGTGMPAGTGIGIWAFDSGGNHLLLRQGDLVDGIKIGALNVLTPVAGSLGQGRYKDANLAALVTLVNKTQAIIHLNVGAPLEVVAATGDAVTGLPTGNQLLTFGVPTVSLSGNSACLATLRSGVGGVSAGNNQLILADSNVATLGPLARKGDPTPEANGTKFAVLSNPVYNAQSATAFVSTLTGPGVAASNQTGIWWNGPDGFKLIARAGGEAAGVPGAKWASFLSLALPDNADPVFVAKLAPGTGGTVLPNGIGATNNTGVWAIDSTGALRLMVRTGDTLKVNEQPKTLSLLTILTPVLGAPGQARSYNGTRHLTFRAVFTDHTQAIMDLVIP